MYAQKIQSDGGRQGTIFCIDAAHYMHEVNEDDEEKRTHILIALKAIRSEMNKICLSADFREMVGIIFFNTTKTNIEAEGLDNIFCYQKIAEFRESGFLKAIDAEAVKHVDQLISDEKVREEFFKETLGGSGQCDLSQLLWLVRRNFRYDLKAPKQNVWIFSRSECMSDYSKVMLAKVKAEFHEALASGIQVFCRLLGDENIPPHWDIFENEENLDDDYEFRVKNFASLETLSNDLKRKNVARRPTTTISLHLAPKIKFAVSIYHLVLPQKLESGVYLDKKTNSALQRKTVFVKQPTGNEKLSFSDMIGEDADEKEEREVVDPKKIKLIRKFGGTTIELSPEKMEKLKRIDAPGIHIIGFKPMECLKTHHQVGATQYLYPNEDLVNGSGRIYRALLTKCLERNVFILARFVLKTNTMPKLVALVPQRRGDLDSPETDVEKHFYEGFHVIRLPFAEDTRSLQSKLEGDWEQPTKEQVKAAETFINKVTAPYNPENFCNPQIQKHYWVLEGLATDNSEYPDDHEFDQIKPYFKSYTRGLKEAENFADKL